MHNVTQHMPSAAAVARALGWFGIALGAAELLMPGAVARASGLRGRDTLVRACGAREIATGIGLLASRRPMWWMWARVAGDALDAATLSRGRSRQAGLSLAVVAAVAAADVACAAALSRPRRAAPPAREDSRRSGLPRAPAQMRGAARSDFETPQDMQVRPRLRPYRPDPSAERMQSAQSMPSASPNAPRWPGA
jgi:hypothetical protein